MKRNMDLVREMLLVIEAAAPGQELRPRDLAGIESTNAIELLEHVVLLGQAHFIQAEIRLPSADRPEVTTTSSASRGRATTTWTPCVTPGCGRRRRA